MCCGNAGWGSYDKVVATAPVQSNSSILDRVVMVHTRSKQQCGDVGVSTRCLARSRPKTCRSRPRHLLLRHARHNPTSPAKFQSRSFGSPIRSAKD
ncbi:hypothetical protein QE152_g37886 [Popillia japonica]|uniref:Uncharacterized protein n=1 Tax=Popillia japonica TaxID=7064 RepID=A0AAW1I9L8_POPJA